jgi:hypothetical protein
MYDVEEYQARQAFLGMDKDEQRMYADLLNVYDGSYTEEEFEDCYGMTVQEAEKQFE